MLESKLADPADIALRGAFLAWFAAHARDLPWRRTRDPYAIWVSEVMLQQTQVATVIPYWERFLARFPTAMALAAAQQEDVFALWRGLGYYSRARNLHAAAKELVARHGGALPASLEALRSLPGFGPYTAGAVASIAFDLPAPIVDGNVARVLSRLFAVEGTPGNRTREKRLWELAARLVEGDDPGGLNQALMELGALVCRPTEPLCLLCPVRDPCAAFRQGRVAELPPARVRASKKALDLAAAVVERDGRLLLARRESSGLFGGLWEPPSLEWAADAPSRGLLPAFRRLLGVRVRLGPPRGVVRRVLTHRTLTVRLHTVQLTADPRAASPYEKLGWFTVDEAAELGMSTAMASAVRAALDNSGA